MDWRNNKLWRKKLRRLDEKTAEFDLLVQRTIKGIAIGKEIRRNIQLLEGTPTHTKKVSGWKHKFGNIRNFRENIFFWKKLR